MNDGAIPNTIPMLRCDHSDIQRYEQMIQFLILLTISPILIPAFGIVCAAIGMLAGLWFGAFLVIGMFDLFLAGWKE